MTRWGGRHVFEKALREQGIPWTWRKQPTDHSGQPGSVAIAKWDNQLQTVNMRLRTPRQFFAFMVEEGYLPETPASRVEKPRTAETIIVAMTDDQVRRILATPDRKTFTGLRDYTIMVVQGAQGSARPPERVIYAI